MRAEFAATALDGGARTGTVHLAGGTFRTPCFMPVGTRGAVRHLSSVDLADLGAEVVLGNTYHLMLRPGGKRSAIMQLSDDGTSDPLLLRIFALGLLRAKADRATVAAILERDKRNALLTHYLEPEFYQFSAHVVRGSWRGFR